MTKRSYPCEFCDTDQPRQPRLVTLTMPHGDQWFIFENVPAQVCPNCGHRYYAGPMLLDLERLIDEHPEQARKVEAFAFSLPRPNP